jgi:uncharacterized LabA/DUF88 family protein
MARVINISKKKQIYAFIDNQNLNVTIQSLGWKVNWQRFRKFLTDKYGVTQAYMFIGYVPEFEDMYEKLHDAGFSIVLKPTYDMTKPRPEEEPKKEEKKSEEAEEKKPVKGNVDAELVLWAMKEMPNYDKAVIVSGDGDFYSLVEYLEEQGKLGKILTPSWKYSSLFNKYESYIERVDQNRRQLEYKKFLKKPAK